MDVEAGVAPGKQALRPLRAEKFPADEKRQGLPGEDLRQPRVVHPRDLIEDARRVHAALGHQEMEVGLEINPVPEGLDGSDNTGLEGHPRRGLKIEKRPLDATAAKIAQEPAPELDPIIKEVVERYLDCGNPRCGFARIRFPDLGADFLGY